MMDEFFKAPAPLKPLDIEVLNAIAALEDSACSRVDIGDWIGKRRVETDAPQGSLRRKFCKSVGYILRARASEQQLILISTPYLIEILQSVQRLQRLTWIMRYKSAPRHTTEFGRASPSNTDVYMLTDRGRTNLQKINAAPGGPSLDVVF